MRARLAWLFWPLLAACFLALVSGFAGALKPAFDSLAVFRLQLATTVSVLALALCAIAPGHRRVAVAVLAAALALAAPAALSYWPAAVAATPAALTVYQKNLNYRSGDLDRIAEDVLSTGADVVTVQEVSERNVALLELLRAAYPYQAYCPHATVGGAAVLSRIPATGDPPACARDGGFAALRVAAPGGPLWVVSVHFRWPWPQAQAYHARRLESVLEGLGAPMIVGGDFNMVPWGASVTRFARAARAEVVGPTTATFDLFGGLLPLPIDHVLLPGGWSGAKELRPKLGSDHRGVVVRARILGMTGPGG